MYHKYIKYKIKYLKHKMNNANNDVITYNVNIKNPPYAPWLDFIESGEKTYEGRLYRGFGKK